MAYLGYRATITTIVVDPNPPNPTNLPFFCPNDVKEGDEEAMYVYNALLEGLPSPTYFVTPIIIFETFEEFLREEEGILKRSEPEVYYQLVVTEPAGDREFYVASEELAQKIAESLFPSCECQLVRWSKQKELATV